MKYDLKILARHGIDVAPIDDTLLLSYALHAGEHNHGMDELSERYLGHVPIAIKTLIGVGKAQRTFDRVPLDGGGEVRRRGRRHHAAAVADVQAAAAPPPGHHRLRDAGAAADPGAGADGDGRRQGRPRTRSVAHVRRPSPRTWRGLEAEIYGLAGREFNVGSPKQLGEILFDEMSLTLPDGRKPRTGKTGAYATGADVLEDLATMHDLPRRILDWRQISQAEIDLYRRAAGPHQPRDGAGPHLLLHRRGQHRPARLDRPEPAEHPDPDRGRAAHPRGLRRRAGQAAGQPRLLARSSCASSPTSPGSTR